MPCRTSKRCRLPSDARPWASLPQDLVELIGWRVLAGDLRDYVRFRAVCSHWNTSTPSPRGRGLADPRFHPRQWMMLPEGHGLLLLHRHPDTAIRLLHPFTGKIAELPPLSTVLPLIESLARSSCFTGDRALRDLGTFLKVKGICAAVTITATGAISVMLAHDMMQVRSGDK